MINVRTPPLSSRPIDAAMHRRWAGVTDWWKSMASAVLLCLVALPAGAQTIDPAKAKALDRFMAVMNAERAYQAMGQSTLNAFGPLVMLNRDRQQEAVRIIEAELVPEVRAIRPTFFAALRSAYAKRFTTAELNQISAFLESPAGRKLRASDAQVPADTRAALKPFETRVTQTIAPRVLAKLKAAGLKTPEPLLKPTR